MSKIIRIVLLIVITTIALNASMALSKTKPFMQPDGTEFQGVLKGNSSFHWIESNGEIIKYNPKDKFYYKSIFDEVGNLVFSKERAGTLSVKKSSSLKKIEHKVSQDKSLKLQKIQKSRRSIKYPR